MSSQDHKQALPVGFSLGSYRVVRVLGAGGFGVTYLCEHEGLRVQVAIKEYLPNEIAVRDGSEVHAKSTGDRDGFEWGLGRFLDEAMTLARFEHPNVVRVRDCFEANNTAYIVMDYEDGESLDALLERHGTLTEAQLKRVVLPVADGLRQVHAAGFLHRDVKPSNIFVRRSDESPVLLDFGSARQALGRKSKSMTAIASIGYSPPEQYESQGNQGAWTDIYALSALCYRAITGEVPVEAPRRIGEVARSQRDPQARLATAGTAGYSASLLDSIDRGLRLIETDRPQSLEEWLPPLERGTERRHSHESELRQAGQPVSASTSRPASKETDKRGGRAVWLVAGSLLLIGLAWLAVQPEARTFWIRKAAELQYAKAQYSLGSLYELGSGVPQDYERAAFWYRKAAEQGDADAQWRLGRLFEAGDGVSRDPGGAPYWYRKAADQGHAAAQRSLGSLYDLGSGVPQDSQLAASWYRKAAEQGDAEAQWNLAAQYEWGHGVP